MIDKSEISMESATERPVKKIIVSLWSRSGLVGWRLVDARKQGRHYIVNQKALENMPPMKSPLEAYLVHDDASPISFDNHNLL
jgi:hypothetical protein